MTRLSALVLLLSVAGTARADTVGTVTALGYASSLAAGGVATAVNGVALAFGEPSGRGWRIFGYVAGGVDLAWGAAIFAAAHDRTEGLVTGSLALAVGAAALTTALLVDEEPPATRLVPVVAPGAVGLSLSGRF